VLTKSYVVSNSLVSANPFDREQIFHDSLVVAEIFFRPPGSADRHSFARILQGRATGFARDRADGSTDRLTGVLARLQSASRWTKNVPAGQRGIS
jgi:hypothetical protein